MSTITHGADLTKLKTLAGQLNAAANAINTATNNLVTDIKGLKWDGEDATKYKSTSANHLTTTSNKLETTLRAAARKIEDNLADQRRATQAGGDFTGGSGGNPTDDSTPAANTPENPASAATPDTPPAESPTMGDSEELGAFDDLDVNASVEGDE